MHILVVGLNHRATPVEVRERLAFAQAELGEALLKLAEHVREGVILSTCNRTEVYALATDASSDSDALRSFLSQQRAVPLQEFAPYLYSYHEPDSVRHLFRVTAGLDAMVLGEAQILGQVREAFEVASARGSVGPVLSTLFRQALSVGKRAHTETDISKSAASVSYAAVELARKIFGSLASRVVLIIGAGETGKLTLKTLVDTGVGQVLVCNRTYERAWELASRFHGRVYPYDRLAEALALADIVISSTAAPGFVLDVEAMRAAMRARNHRPVFLIDIAVPRDIDPQVQKLENVFLYDIDDLQALCQANLQERGREVKKVEAIIEAEVNKFLAWWDSREVVPTITALRAWAEEVRQAELAKALGKVRNLSERDRSIINALTAGIVNKLLHPPTVELKEHGRDKGYLQAVRHLFRLGEKT